MKAWKYSRGNWIETEFPFEWNDGENLPDALKRADYGTEDLRVGSDFWNCIRAYTKKGKTIYPVLLDVNPLGDAGGEMVVVDDFPSLMMFLRDYAPLFSLSSIEYRIEEIEQTIDRAFRAWHGHAASDVCRECDPWAMELRRRLREEKRSSS